MIFYSHLILSNVSHLEPSNCFNNSLLGKKRNFVPRTLWILIWFISSSVSSVQSLSYVLLFATPWTVAGQASLSITNSQSLLRLMFIELVMPSNHLILCRPLLLPPSIFQMGLFKWVSSSHQVAKVLEFQLQHQSFQRIFRTDFLYDGLLGSPCYPRDSQESSRTPQFKSIILWCSAFFKVQLSHPYMTTGKTIALTRRTFVAKVISLLFNMLPRLVIILSS